MAAPARSIKWDGRQITKPGLYAGIGLDLYHSQKICDGPSVSSSGLRKLFSESPAHFYETWDGNPNRVEPKDKAHFSLGRALHHLMLGEPFFAKLFCIQPDEYESDKGELKPWSNNAIKCKEWNAARKTEGRTILTSDHVETIKGMAKKLGSHPIVKAGALNGDIERSGFYKDKETGLWVKWRPDSIPGDSGDFVDLKTTISVKWEELARTIFDYGYHQQLALIRSGARAIGIPFSSATLIFVEKTNPYCVRVVTIKDVDLDRGEKANRVALDAMAECLKRKHWPGPGGDREDAEHIELQEWAQKKIDDRLRYGIPT